MNSFKHPTLTYDKFIKTARHYEGIISLVGQLKYINGLYPEANYLNKTTGIHYSVYVSPTGNEYRLSFVDKNSSEEEQKEREEFIKANNLVLVEHMFVSR